jgi:hypothetical protein
VSHLRDATYRIWLGGMCGHHSLAALTLESSERQEGVPKAAAHDAGIRSSRCLTSEPSEKPRVTIRRRRWTNRR